MKLAVVGVALVAALKLYPADPPARDAVPPNPLQARVDTLEARNLRLARLLKRSRTRQRRDHRALLRAARQWRPTVLESIHLAAIAYGQSSSTLIRKASCESHLWPWAHNPSGASGLFQFLPSTWRSTPYGGFSIWNPLAQALAAGWMHRVGRGNEWSCR